MSKLDEKVRGVVMAEVAIILLGIAIVTSFGYVVVTVR
jgi:hypothetical protein